jgi:hypothetical protein
MLTGAHGRPARLQLKPAICTELPRVSWPNSNRTRSACCSDSTDNRKVPIRRHFQAADGTRTHDLLHDKNNLIRRRTPLFACKLRFFGPRGPEPNTPRFEPIPGDSPNHFRMGLRRLGRLLTARRSTGRPLDETSTLGGCHGSRDPRHLRRRDQADRLRLGDLLLVAQAVGGSSPLAYPSSPLAEGACSCRGSPLSCQEVDSLSPLREGGISYPREMRAAVPERSVRCNEREERMAWQQWASSTIRC